MTQPPAHHPALTQSAHRLNIQRCTVLEYSRKAAAEDEAADNWEDDVDDWENEADADAAAADGGEPAAAAASSEGAKGTTTDSGGAKASSAADAAGSGGGTMPPPVEPWVSINPVMEEQDAYKSALLSKHIEDDRDRCRFLLKRFVGLLRRRQRNRVPEFEVSMDTSHLDTARKEL